MSKTRVFGIVLAAAAGVMIAGSSMAAAGAAPGLPLEPGTSVQPVVAPGEPDPTGTGSSKAITDIVKALSTGSGKGGTTTP
ncbi:hypothetical protein DFR70_104438 [Nocardia tenerifensis]|uniref:Uncharacterized protein n=1 Tax=Nocardia tenerifensis TaxID=228006 RepID=A0A318K1J0_9NOCA|nr:hypothetical protein [Nocardia tenerifensis]PXX65374.1 hypothetical protein DFR70_104438 [Nocardia tenerifensis]